MLPGSIMRHSTSHIRTERLWLREIDESDTATIVRLRTETEVYKFFKSPHRLTEKEHIDWYRNKYVVDVNRIDWIAVDDNDGSIVGLFHVAKKQNVVEVSYLLDKGKRGNGYAAEAMSAIMDVISLKWKPQKFIAIIHACNLKSREFIEKLGFKQEYMDGEFIFYSRIRR